jgi:predicted flap endonuclease-1-like 5' DNA nuclease
MTSLLPWLMLLLGIIIGWLLAWLFSRGGRKELEAQVAQLRADLAARDKELADCRGRISSLQTDYDGRIKALDAQLQSSQARLAAAEGDCQARITALQAELEAARNQVRTFQSEAASGIASRGVSIDLGATPEPAPMPDDLTKIRGIGPAFAARLSAAGIRRYTDLAAADPQELAKAADVREWQKVDTSQWAADAKVLAGRPRQIDIGDDLTRLEGIGPTYATRLRAAGITTFAHLAGTDEATLSEIIGAPAWRNVNYGDWIAQAKLAAAGDEAGLKALQDRLFSRKGDNLLLIEGVGENTAEALRKAGITSYAALAQATPEQLRQILSRAGVRGGNVEAWIAEAKLRAAGKRVKRGGTRTRTVRGTAERTCPQDLEPVKGIGRVYEQRLYAVGVGTYWELGMLPEEELAAILEVQNFQDVDLTEIKADAMRLARETDTMGQMWDGSEPDDFEPLEGIGPVLEGRLYAAGICTFAALAATSAERLAEICKAPAFSRPNYARWIEQARERLG